MTHFYLNAVNIEPIKSTNVWTLSRELWECPVAPPPVGVSYLAGEQLLLHVLLHGARHQAPLGLLQPQLQPAGPLQARMEDACCGGRWTRLPRSLRHTHNTPV